MENRLLRKVTRKLWGKESQPDLHHQPHNLDWPPFKLTMPLLPASQPWSTSSSPNWSLFNLTTTSIVNLTTLINLAVNFVVSLPGLIACWVLTTVSMIVVSFYSECLLFGAKLVGPLPLCASANCHPMPHRAPHRSLPHALTLLAIALPNRSPHLPKQLTLPCWTACPPHTLWKVK